MTKDLNQLSREELGQLFPIIISEPQSTWPKDFAREKENLENLLGEDTAIRIEHIGSTAVPNLPAKPTIDILIEIPSGEEVADEIIPLMKSHGYYHMREQKDHLMFAKGYSPEGYQGQSYHVHMARKDQVHFWDRLLFRDYLIAHPEVAEEYAQLKKDLASLHKHDREAYTETKSEFINAITEKARKASGAAE